MFLCNKILHSASNDQLLDLDRLVRARIDVYDSMQIRLLGVCFVGANGIHL